MNLRLISSSLVGALVSAGLGVFAENWSGGGCGQARIPQDANIAGVVCLSVCAKTDAIVSCALPGKDISTSAAFGPGGKPPVSGIKTFGLQLRPGHRVTLAELARQLRALTGWELVFNQLEGSAELAALNWNGSWSDLVHLELRTRDGRSFFLRADDANHRLEVRGGAGAGTQLGR